MVIKDGSEADGSTANTLRVKVTDAFGNTLAGQTVSVLADNGATVAPTVITEPDGTVEDLSHQPDRRNQCGHRQRQQQQPEPERDVCRRCQDGEIADLVVTRDNSVADGAMANTLRVRVTDAFGNTLAGQTVSVMAEQQRNGVSDGHYRAGRHGGDQYHQPDSRNQYRHCQHQQQQPEPERDVYCGCQDGEDR